MSATRKALWFIEAHYAQNITLADIARAAALSPFHLSRLFQAATGIPVVRYLRDRRLTVAAHQLAAGAPDILQVALSVGYRGHGSFSRAFSEQFGCSPRQVRGIGTANLDLQPPIDLTMPPMPCAVAPTLQWAAATHVIGVSARQTAATVAGIPALWQQLANEAGSVQGPLRGVCCDADGEGGFDYIAGIACASSTPLPSGWRRIDIAPRHYVVARHQGHVANIRATWAWLLDSHLPSQGLQAVNAPDLECYDPRFDPRTGMGGVDIWIPVRDFTGKELN